MNQKIVIFGACLFLLLLPLISASIKTSDFDRKVNSSIVWYWTADATNVADNSTYSNTGTVTDGTNSIVWYWTADATNTADNSTYGNTGTVTDGTLTGLN